MDKVTFRVNGKEHSVGSEVSSSTTLLEYLRRTLELRGTKYMCLEGGCGACIVNAVNSDGESHGVNSCMVSITSCQDWDITTIEKVGNRLDGYHPLQVTLAKAHGSQCGYCSSGMIMNMFSLLKSKKLKMLEIEKSLGSNLCRCTGYRPILEAFKKFASDAPEPISLTDIEDLKICEKSGKECAKRKCEGSEWCFVSRNEVYNEILHIKLSDNRDWYRANTLTDVLDIWREKGVQSYMLVAGNTAKGIYPILEYPRLLIDVSCIPELKGHYLDQNLVLGAGTTLGDVITLFTTLASNDGFGYLKVLVDHLNLIAHVTIRNLATLAGNLMTKNRNHSFKSDIHIILETVNAQLTILTRDGLRQTLSVQAFLKEDMTGKILINVILPPLSSEYKLVTYKVMPRYQNAHAMVHAGFLYKIDDSNTVLDCRIVFGALSPNFNRAFKTESYLIGKKLFVNETLQRTLQILNKELVVVEDLGDPSVQYRRQASLGLFYKGLVSLCPSSVLNNRYRSGAVKLRDTRPVSEAHRDFDTNPALWPLNKPMDKVDALVQCAGEAKYTDDTPALPQELFLAFVLAKVLGTIEKIDPSRALSEPGVVAFYSASDIPGKNSFTPSPSPVATAEEELFCNRVVKYFDQVLGVVVAESQSIANKAATMVDVQFINERKPMIDVKKNRLDPSRFSVFASVPATSTGKNVARVIKGNDTIYAQCHFPMETLVCVAHPTEEGLKIVAASQYLDAVQQATARVLNLDQSRIDVHVQRVGGAYGFKISQETQVAVATALAAYKLNRPCRFINPLEVNMRAMGKRFPCSRDFEVGVDANGVIQYVNCDLYGDNGYIFNEPILVMGLDCYYNAYRKDLWKYTVYNTLTDTASNTWCRAPGTLENIVMAEIMMERIAYELNLDPLEVRLANLDMEKYSDLKTMTETLKNNSQYDERKTAVDIFNKNNRWKKRGIRFCFMKWNPPGYLNLEINLSVYADDGTVVITHAGVETGQGINTKAVQICAYLLNISVEKVRIKPNDTVISPNCFPSAGSVTAQHVGIGVKRCCEELLKRLEPVRAQMTNPTWPELIKKAYASQVDLQVHDYTTAVDNRTYDIFGVALAEVEIDILTGEWQILQVDVVEDAGLSVNPELDIGQVEGAFIMGVGYWTTENLVYDSDTGELFSNRTWDYWIPQASDIPQVFRTYLKKRSYSDRLILGSKATGEPATCMGVVVALAMRAAITQARLDSGIPTNQWFTIDGPFTVDKICVSTATRLEEFRFY